MMIKEITDKNIWENFIVSVKEKTFLQSWNWGDFQKMMGNKIWRFGVYENSKLVSVALVIKTVARRGSFLLVPHGPIVRKQKTGDRKQVMKVLMERLKELAKKERVSFIRISPIWERNKENIKIFKDLDFREAPIHTHPEATWELDISPSEEELLMKMRKTTRYLIRQALKSKDIEVFQSQKLEDVEVFNNLHQEVVKRQHFTPFSLDYFKKEVSVFSSDNQISLFFGRYQREITASAFAIFWSNIGFYHHAALLPRYRKIPVAYSLLWEAIREAKKRGCNFFDFWGYVDPFKNPKHPWAGPTLFKMGFGGYKKEYVKTQDFVLSQKYWLNWFIEKIRHKKRGF